MEVKRIKDYLIINFNEIDVVFTTAEKGRSFNRNTEEGIHELQSIKNDFNVNEVAYLKQIHSDFVLEYENGNTESFINNEGDAIITNKTDVAVGVFTADCVPVIIVDEVNKVIAAVHSGWRGTFDSITYKTLVEMQKKYDCKSENIQILIGPHIRQCCYEISEDLKEEFINKKDISEEIMFNGRKLNMEACIEDDAIRFGVNKENIHSLNLCTHCSENIRLFSYRKSKGTYGRMFAFAYIK